MTSPPSLDTHSTFSWYLYPCETRKLKKDELVYVKSKSTKPGKRARVVQVMDDEQRLLVRYNQHHEQNVALKRCLPIYSCSTDTTATVILTRETRFYRHLCASHVGDADRVLEIGCSTGQASAVLLKATTNWMGIDISKDMVQQATEFLTGKGHKNIESRVHVLDVLSHDDKEASKRICHVLENRGGPTAIFIDIGGNRDIDSTIRVLQWCLSTYKPRLVVVKNREMVDDCLKICRLDSATGRLVGGHDWFQSAIQTVLAEGKASSRPEHPLQAGMICSPVDNISPICRYHNYHISGCKKANECPFDHNYCHFCRQAGHVARLCPMRSKIDD